MVEKETEVTERRSRDRRRRTGGKKKRKVENGKLGRKIGQVEDKKEREGK